MFSWDTLSQNAHAAFACCKARHLVSQAATPPSLSIAVMCIIYEVFWLVNNGSFFDHSLAAKQLASVQAPVQR